MTQYYKIMPDGYPSISAIQVEDYIAYTVGAEPQELLDAISAQAIKDAEAEAKAAREIALNSITVTTTSGKVFDGREKDVSLMSGAIQAAEVLGLTEHSWKLHDNTVQVVTLAELKEALALAMQKIGEIKVS